MSLAKWTRPANGEAEMSQIIHKVLKRIAAELEDADGDFVAGIYNQVFADPIQYVGDSMFEPLELSTLQHQV